MSLSLLKNTSDGTMKGRAINALSKYNEGSVAHARLFFGGAVVDEETVKIGEDTYEVHVVNTDTGVNVEAIAVGDTAIETKASVSDISAGDVLRVGTEYMKVRYKHSGTQYEVVRGFAGSTAAVHGDDSDLYQATQAAGDGNLEIPFHTSLTAGTAETHFVRGIKYWQTGYVPHLGPGSGLVVRAKTQGLTAQADTASGVHAMYLFLPGGATIENSEAIAASTTTISNFSSESEPMTRRYSSVSVVVTNVDDTSQEVTRIAFPFEPVAARVTQFRSGVAVSSNPPSHTVDGQVVVVTEGANAGYDDDDVVVVEAFGE